MEKEDILKIIQELNEKQTETICIEAKTANKGKPEKYYDTISSFANTMGGVLLFGIEERKIKNKTTFVPVGVYDVNDLQKNITNLCSTEFEPIIRPEISVIKIENKDIVAVRIDVLTQRNKPCYYKPKGLHNGSYIRVGDRDENMTEYEIYKCISYRENEQDDKRPVLNATMDDFDKELLNEFIVKAKKGKEKFSKFSDEDILLTMGVLTKVEDKIFPTVAGIMVLGIYPQKFFPQWFVAAMLFPGFKVAELGEEGQRFNDNKRIDGNIPEMYNETINFIERNTKLKMRINEKTGLREDIPEYPLGAVREAVSNILIHRDMSPYKEGTYSSVSIFKNRIEFRNVGNLYGSNTIEKIISERDIEVRNKTVVGILETLGEVLENRHTGIKTMISEMNKVNLPKPVFENQREDFLVTLYNGEYAELLPEKLKEEKGKNAQENAQNAQEKGKNAQENAQNAQEKGENAQENAQNAQEKNKKRTRKVLEELILNYCTEAKTIKQIAQEFEYKNIRSFRERYITPLLIEGKLKMTIPENPKNRNQKYITNK